ncbi:MAG: primosomal protein N' [Saprospiraceae bacterium]|nr:primosomal protein N' [Saprospiraceae bacterium]
MLFADIILPLPINDTYTYSVPDELTGIISPGHRVEVQFGSKKRYSGIVDALQDKKPDYQKIKPILALLDEQPIISPVQLSLWHTISSYYVTSLGDVMNAALPAGIKLSSETSYIGHEDLNQMLHDLEGDELTLASAILYRSEMSLDDIESLLGKRKAFPTIKSLLGKGLIEIKEVLKSIYKPLTERYVEPLFSLGNESLGPVLDHLKKARKQSEIILFIIQNLNSTTSIPVKEIESRLPGSGPALKGLVKKGFIRIERKEVSRYGDDSESDFTNIKLSDGQSDALEQVRECFKTKDTVLLHGITGSGKTLIYLKLIENVLAEGKQVLFMVPEISLTTQLVGRFARYFADEVSVYHSSVGSNHKIDLWKEISKGKPLVIAARSGVFLPFTNLGMIIIDEEHDSSFKQNDPIPKYHARETALFLAQLHGAKVILGSATPSFETYHNALDGKYGLVRMTQRYGEGQLPSINLINRNLLENNQKGSHFSKIVIDEMLSRLKKGQQSIVFINRRGYSTMLVCPMCEWTMTCKNCDVSMTFHKYQNKYLCHYCGWTKDAEPACPDCGNVDIVQKGLGTQQIEEELRILFPEANIERLDFDSVRSRTSLNNIFHKMEAKQIDILIGTQMVSKGLDFKDVGLVCVVSADQLARFPDFRAHERAFQLMVQVSGRSGRADRQGIVFIQYGSIRKSLLDYVAEADFDGFFRQELEERRRFIYPPYCRLIRLIIAHKSPEIASDASRILADTLRRKWGKRIYGPAPAMIPRINNQYLHEILIKIERKAHVISEVKDDLRQSIRSLQTTNPFKSVRVTVDVDPM